MDAEISSGNKNIFGLITKSVRKLFPAKPLLGIALAVMFLVEGAAIADTLLQTDSTGVEGHWQETGQRSVGPFTKICDYERTIDGCALESYNPGAVHNACWEQSQYGHHRIGQSSVISKTSICPAEPSTMSSLDLHHKEGRPNP